MRLFQLCTSICLAAATILGGAQVNAALISADTFAHDDVTGLSQVPGTTTDFGGQTWQISFQNTHIAASGDSFDAGSGSVYFATGGGAGIAGDYVNFSTIGSGGVFVQAEVKPLAGPDGSGDWISIGFNPNGNPMYDNPGPWALLTAAGAAELFDGDIGGAPSTYRSAVATTGFTFNSGGYNLLTLEYDLGSQVMTLSVNGTPTLSLSYAIGTGHTAPGSITGAGFFAYNQPSNGRVDAFEVFTPEPASLTLLVLGGGVTLTRRRRPASDR